MGFFTIFRAYYPNKTLYISLFLLVTFVCIVQILFTIRMPYTGKNYFIIAKFSNQTMLSQTKSKFANLTRPPFGFFQSKMTFNKSRKKIKSLNLSRCDEIRRRVSWGIVDYAEWDGDEELIELLQPIFTKKRLVVWGLDPHPGPTDDMRSLMEPLGVEFLEHIIMEPKRCHRMCVCSMSENLPHLTLGEVYRPNQNVFDRIYNDPRASVDIARADAFIIGPTVPYIELYMRYNKSIILVTSLRYNYAVDFDKTRWLQLNKMLQDLLKSRKHVIGANNLYDLEFLHYFLGVRPDYVSGFAGYTGEHYQPSKRSFLYARQPYGVPKFWNAQFEIYYKIIKATFILEHFVDAYKSGHEFSDLTKHLGIVHQPYQVCIIF